MSRFFRNFKSESQKRGERAPLKPRRLATETLEDRRLLAVSPEILTALNGYESFGDYSSDSVSTIEIAKDDLTLEALNDAISQAAATPGDDAILIVGGGTLTFQPGDKAISIELDDATQGALTIIGYNGTFEIDANNVDRAFSIKSGTVKLGSIEISNGSADFGGAIANAGDLYLEDAVFSNNAATVSGGALADKGWVSVENSQFLANEAAENGAAIYRGDFEFAKEEEVDAPEATGTISDVSAAFGETVEIDLSQYFSEGDWKYSVKLPSELSDALAAEPTVSGNTLTLKFLAKADYALDLDLSDVELVVAASTADGSASVDSNAFNVGLTDRYSARLAAVLTDGTTDDAYDYEKGKGKNKYFGDDEIPAADATATDGPLSVQLWSEDLSAAQGMTLQSNVAFTFVLKLENATLDLEDLYADDGFYAEFFNASGSYIKTSADLGYEALGENEYWVSVLYNYQEKAHGVQASAMLLASLPVIATGEGDVSATLEPWVDVRDPLVYRCFDGVSYEVDLSQVDLIGSTTASASAAVLSNAEIAAAETTETRAAVLRDVVIANNTAAGQGAIYVAADSTAALLINATVVDNDVAGAAFVSAANGSQAVDSIFVGNGAAVSGVALQTVLTDDGAEGALAYDASKPLFADAENGDYSLAKNAQVIDLATGTTASETDLAGAARVSGTAADLGAYEYQGVAPSAPTDVKFGAYDAAKQSATLTWADVADETGYRVEAKIDGKWTLVDTLAADATSYVATGLAANGSYEYRVSAFNNFGASAAVAATVSTLVAPTAPTGLVLSNYDATAAKLTMKWNDNADNETTYVVAVALVGSSNWKTTEYEADATGCRFTSVDPTKSYIFRVYASNAAGDSEYIEATFNAATDVLTGLDFSTDAPKVGEELAITVAPTTANVALQWFRVDASGAETAIDGATSATYTPTSADLGSTLKVVATGLNASYASIVSATSGVVAKKLTAPSAPKNVAFGEYDAESQVAPLTWVDNSAIEEGYLVEALIDGEWVEVGMTGENETTFYATDLEPGKTYEYRVSAFNAAGSSATVSATITIPALETAPSAPTNVAFGEYIAEDGVAPLTWVDVADNETGYLVEMQVDGEWVEVGMTGENETTFYATDLEPGKTYEYRVSAFNAAGSSDYAYATITTPKDEEPEPSKAPAAPSNFVFGAYDAANNALSMSWTDNSDDESAFVVQYSVDGGKTWLASATLKANETGRVASYVWANKEYQFRVSARNAEGSSDWVYASFDARVDVLTPPAFSTDAPALDEPIAAVFDSESANATFQWYRVEADGTETLIEGATNAEYLPTAADVGLRLKVVASSANPAYAATVSAVSEIVLETARFQPTAPSNVVFADYDPATQKMSMAWNDNSNNEKYFEIEYRKDTGASAGQWRSAAKVGRDVEGRVCSMVYGDTNFEFRVRAVYEYVDESGETVKLYSDWAEASFQYGRDVVTSVELSTDAPQVGVEISATIPDRVIEATQGGKPVSVDATFQWYRVVEGVATAIEGATSATYVPTLDDVGCQLQAVATSANVAYVSSAAGTTAQVVGETADSRPVPPSGIVFGQYDPETDTLAMSWTNNSETATKIVVEYRSAGGAWKVAQILDGSATGRVAQKVYADRVYDFRIKAVVGEGEAALESVYATASFDARRDILEGASFTCDVPTVGEATRVVIDGARNEATFQWYRVDAEGNETAIEGATNAAYAPTASDVGFVLKVVATAANGAYDSQISATTEVVVATPSVPNAPTNVVFGAYDATRREVELSWNDASNNETGFYVEYSVDGGKTWRASETMDANETARRAWGLRVGTTYQFRVAAFNTAGVSEWTVASFQVPAPAASAAVLETAFEDDDLVDGLIDELDDFFATLD